jgi:flagellar motility protein MotE (MotC chaperone)
MSKVLSMLRSPWLATMVGMLLFFVTSAVLTALKLPPPRLLEEAHARASITGPSWEFFNPELDQLIDELRKEREAIAAKDKELKELATRLQVEREELDNTARSIRELQAEFDRDLVRLKEDEAGNLKRLAKMYALMDPASAAHIMKEMDDGVLVKIMLLMKEEQSAPVLDALAKLGSDETKRAARISETLRLAVPIRKTTDK